MGRLLQAFHFTKSLLRGIGQIMFQRSSLTGVLFLAGIFFNSPVMGVGAILGAAVGTWFALVMDYPQKEIFDGLYGFNGALTGIAIWYFYDVSLITFMCILTGAILSAWLMFQMKKFLPPYTAPFVLSTWLVIFVIRFFNLSNLLQSNLPDLIAIDYAGAIGASFGQVMLQINIITGLIFLIAILLHSRMSAAYAIYGSLLALGIAILMSFPVSTINAGVWGYNAILCAIALGNKTVRGFLLATVAILISIILNAWLGRMSIIALTAPFVAATWLSLASGMAIGKLNQIRQGRS